MSNYSEVKKTGKNPKKPKPQRSGFTRFLLKLMGVLIVLSILAGIGGFIMLKWSEDKLAQPMPVDTMFNVKQGSSLHSVITQLSTANLIECEPCLRWHVRIFGGKNIKAGTYQFKGDMSSMDILNMLEKGEVALVPGSAFGLNGHLRLSFATSQAALDKALDKLQKFIDAQA